MKFIESEIRPWGVFFVIHDESNYKLKRIEEFESPYIFQWNNTNDKEDNSYNYDIKEKRDRWIESLKKDIYVNEAMNLLRDLSSIKSNEILSQINLD